jgi:hypothetical protein
MRMLEEWLKQMLTPRCCDAEDGPAPPVLPPTEEELRAWQREMEVMRERARGQIRRALDGKA